MTQAETLKLKELTINARVAQANHFKRGEEKAALHYYAMVQAYVRVAATFGLTQSDVEAWLDEATPEWADDNDLIMRSK